MRSYALMNEAPCSASFSVDSSVPLKTGSPVWLLKSEIITAIGAIGAFGPFFKKKAAYTPPSTTRMAITHNAIHFHATESVTCPRRGALGCASTAACEVTSDEERMEDGPTVRAVPPPDTKLLAAP